MKRISSYIFIKIGFFLMLLLAFQQTHAQEVKDLSDSIPMLSNDTLDTINNIEDSLSAQELLIDSIIVRDSTTLKEEIADSISNKKERKGLFHKMEPAPHPYLSIGTDVGRYVYQSIVKGAQEYQAFVNYSIKQPLHVQVDAGWGKENINYTHLNYSTNGWFIATQLQYNLLKPSHDLDKDRMYIAPFLSFHQGFISEATIIMNNQSGFSLEEEIDASHYINAAFGAKLGVEVEILPKLLLSWQGQAGILMAPNTFKNIKPNFIPGYGNADRNIGFRFALNLAYYISK